jgi:hypothetical protein
MRRGNFTIRIWQRGQEQSCSPDALGGGVMDGFVNATGELVPGPQATAAARNKEFIFRRSTARAEKDTAQTAVSGGEVTSPRWMRLRRHVRRRRAPRCGWT